MTSFVGRNQLFFCMTAPLLQLNYSVDRVFWSKGYIVIYNRITFRIFIHEVLKTKSFKNKTIVKN